MSYTKSLGLEKTLSVLGELVQICVENGGRKTKAVAELALSRKFIELMDFELTYEASDDVNDLICARQILGFYTKYEQLELGIDKEEAAFAQFIEAERRCKETNHRMRTDPAKGRIAQVEHYAMRKISRVLGDLPDLADLKLQYGPGANTSVKASCVNPRVKLSARLDCNHNLANHVGAFLSEVPLLTTHHARKYYEIVDVNTGDTWDVWDVDVNVVPGELLFVPKTAKIYRVIIKEPGFSGMIQKGYGTYMKARMRQHGLDLTDQEANRKLAYKASIDNKSSTVDMRMASDLEAREVVYRLFPLDWACRLDGLRSSVVTYKGEPIVLEKFSSMGNAFTFELESLTFWALAYGCCCALDLHDKVSEIGTFGDDVIIPIEAYDLFVEVLEYYGFLVNTKKSYKEGPFRESCGVDYFLGIDIRPFYVKEHLTVRSLFTMHNWFVRHLEFELAACVRSHIPDHLALYGPDGYGDGHLIGSHTLRTRRSDRRAGWCGGYFDTYVLKPVTVPKGLLAQKYGPKNGATRFHLRPGDWVYPSYSVYTRSGEQNPTDPNVIRGSKGYAKVSIYSLTTGVFR